LGRVKSFLYKITGGRPMKVIRLLFRDIVSGKNVFEFEDKFGRKWMANHKWGLFRVEKKEYL